MRDRTPGASALVILLLSAGPATPGAAQEPPPPKTSAEIVVSATKLPEDAVDIAGSTVVVTGEELRSRNVRTVAEAIEDVTGIDTANGSDNGSHAANIGVWGVKEFDALLVTVDGVPVGGPFNPSLAQIPIDDIDRIEIVKGPQGTLYGVSAFAGMIQVFTRAGEAAHGTVRAGGASFSEGNASVNWTGKVGPATTVRVAGGIAREGGWQDRTTYSDTRFTLSGEQKAGDATFRLALTTALSYNYFGSPLPYDAGQPVPGFVAERNYAVVGARLDHRFHTVSGGFAIPLGSGWTLEDTLGLTRDEQIQVRSFITATDGLTASATGTSLTPVESTVFNDLRVVGSFRAAGTHDLVGGVGLTWGRTTAAGTGFDFDLVVSPVPVVPSLDQIPVGDHRSFQDRRTFWGLYVNDEWTPVRWLTVTAGARYDLTGEALQATQQEVGTPAPDVTTDSQSNGAWSGGVSALFRLLSRPVGPLDTASLYGSWKSNFKPAAPNLTEAESARILEPERTYSGEAGLKTRWLRQQLSLDLSFFDMTFKNMVVGILGPGGQAALTNAGEERFKGMEVDASWQPAAVPGLKVGGGYAHHDATYVRFSFLTPDGELRVVDGKRVEMVPRDLWYVQLAYGNAKGPGAFVNMRHQNQRPLTRRNTFYTPGFFVMDAGLSWDFPRLRLAVMGRNLTDSRPPVTESEIGDSQYYIATPRRFLGEVTFRF